MGLLARFDRSFGSSPIAKFFKMEERGTTFSTEVAGASATFLTMAYILAVNPSILADSGGTCVPNEADGGIHGPTYENCLFKLRQQFVTATAIGSMIACILMGLIGNLPIALAPGMGMNAYFTYNVVGYRGTGTVTYQAAVTAVMIEGAIFFVLTLSGLRYKIIRLVPKPVRVATPAGIGAFLAHLGLQTAEGIGAVVGDVVTAVDLGACPPENRVKIVAYDALCRDQHICPSDSNNYTCDGGVMTSGRTWLGILGFMLIAICMAYKSKMSFIYGIGLVTIVSWFRGTAVTYFPDDEAGDARFDYFKKVVDITGLDMVLAQFTSDLSNIGLAVFVMLYVDFLDTAGTLMGVTYSMGIMDEDGNFPGSTRAFSVDALSSMIGSIFGLNTITAYIESGAGTEAGARTGLTAIIVGFYFFLAIFFAPILASIPPWAMGGALILVGALMARSLEKLEWRRVTHAVSGFLTVIVMPLTYCINKGLIAGIGSYVIMEGIIWILSLFGLKVPDGGEDAESAETGATKEKEAAKGGESGLVVGGSGPVEVKVQKDSRGDEEDVVGEPTDMPAQ
ncbi:hypothetical protein ACHAWF_016356 [Thalassiosira exigua]